MTWVTAVPSLPLVGALIVTCGSVLLSGRGRRTALSVGLVALCVAAWALAWDRAIDGTLALMHSSAIDMPSSAWLSLTSGLLGLATWAPAALLLAILTRRFGDRVAVPWWLPPLAALSWAAALIGTQLGQGGSWPLASRLLAIETLCLALVLAMIARGRKSV